MWCFVAYVYNGREREKERERDGESTLQDHIIYNEMRIAFLHYMKKLIFFVTSQSKTNHVFVFVVLYSDITYVFTRQFSRVLTPGHSSLGFSRESPAGDNVILCRLCL